MKRLINLTFLGITVCMSGALCSATAGTAYNGDLIIGFTAGSGNDLVYDLGPVSGFTDGRAWNLGSLLSGYDLTILHWGVIGNTLNGIGGTADNTVYTTTAGTTLAAKSLNQAGYNAVYGQVKNMYGLFPAAGAGQYHTIGATASPNSWYSQTFSPTLPTQYKNAYEDPNVSGVTSAVLWGVDTQGGGTKLIGSLSLANNGMVTFIRGTVSSPPPAPELSIARSGLMTTISFTTTNAATYTLRYTNSAGLGYPVTGWPSLPSTVTGDGSMKSFTDTSTETDRVYRVSAH